jgi:1-acyl-sn-glycerol-3-phosphate acyltransferase
MISLLRKIHLFILVFWIVVVFLLFLPFYGLLSRNERTYAALNKFRKAHSYLALGLSGIFVRIHRQEKIDTQKAYIFCSNHSSNLDIFLCCMLANGPFHFMGKEELLKNPLTALFFKTIDVTVNRASKISSFRAFKKVSENLDKGMSLVIFPEGKIGNHYPPRLESFKNGPFRLAIEKEIPIIPISISNAWQLMWDNGVVKGTRPGIIDLYVHQVIETNEMNVDEEDLLKQQVFQAIESKLRYRTI